MSEGSSITEYRGYKLGFYEDFLIGGAAAGNTPFIIMIIHDLNTSKAGAASY
jgi:N-acetylmuramic acid 6-phosphate (MurNAc-6-P) etherase